MKGTNAAKQVVKYFDLHTRIATQVSGYAEATRKVYSKTEPKRRLKHKTIELRLEMLEVITILVEDRFSLTYKPAVTYSENQEIILEIDEAVLVRFKYLFFLHLLF